MAKASHIQVSFNAGELSPTLEGRIDMSKYASGCAHLDNFIPLVQGGAMKRSGTRFVKEVKTSANATRLIPFEFGTTQAYILEFGDQYIRVYKDGAQVLTPSDYDPADAVVEITTPYRTADLDAIQFAQSADVLYLAHPDYNCHKLTRGTDHHLWTLTLIVFDWEPFSPTNYDEDIQVYASATTGTGITLNPVHRIFETFASSAVDTSNNDFNVTAHLFTSEYDQKPCHITTTGALPTGLSASTQYYLKRVDDNNFGLSASAGGSLVAISGAGSGNHTVRLDVVDPVFSSDDVNGYFRLSEIISSNHGVWIGESENNRYTGSNISVGETAYFQGNVYQLKTKNSETKTGTSAPIHETGVASDGRWDWTYLHSGEGYVKITHAGRTCTDGVATSGDATFTSANADFTSADVGKTITINGAGTTGQNLTTTIASLNSESSVELSANPSTAVNPATFTIACTADVIKTLPDSVVGLANATHRWAYGAWSTRNGYPRAVTFFEDRLWWAGTNGNPQTMWGSKTSQYENHQLVDLDESALIFTINTDKVNVIEWVNAGRVMVLGTAGGEFIVSASSETEALTPGNVRVVRHSTYGSKEKIQPLRIDQSLLFVQRAGRRLRELLFDDSANAYVAHDMTVLADHIAVNGIKQFAFQQEPHRIVWVILNDGTLLGFTYERAQQVTAWHRHTVGGTNAKVESIAVIPNPAGNADQLWMIVSRTINGATKRYVEYLEAEWQRGTAVADAFFVDSGAVYSGDSTSTISGLSHLEGQSVTVLAGGATHANKTVSSGAITLDRAVTKAVVGLGYSSTLQTMRIEAGASDGTAQGKTKRITNIVLRLDQTGPGLLYGPTDTDSEMDELHLRDSLDLMDNAIPVFSGDTEVLPWPEGYEQIGRCTVKHTLPGPCTVTAIMPQLLTQDR